MERRTSRMQRIPRYRLLWRNPCLPSDIFTISVPGRERLFGECHRMAWTRILLPLIPVLALLLPQKFEAEKRLRYCIHLLESPLFRDAAEVVIREEIDKGDRERVLSLFPATISNWDGAQNAALLYLSLRDERPATQIVRAVITQKRGRRPDRQHLHT